MSLVSILIVLIIIGLILWLVNQLPLDGTIKNIIHVVVVIFIVLWLLQQLGFVGDLRLR